MEELQDLLAEFSIEDPETCEVPVVTYCNTGMVSCVLYVGLKLAGVRNVQNYDGSMSEWVNSGQNKVELGDLDW